MILILDDTCQLMIKTEVRIVNFENKILREIFLDKL